MFTRLLPAALAGCLLSVAAVAQTTAPLTRIRGTIAVVEGQTLTVATREGPKVDILLNDPLTVATVKKVDLASIAAGSLSALPPGPGPTAKCRRSRCWCFPKRCAALARVTSRGTLSRAA